MHRVVITGAGTINALAGNVPNTLAAMRDGKCGIGPLSFRDVNRLSIKIGGQVKDFDPTDHFNQHEIRLYDRFTQFALLAAREAMAQAGLKFCDDHQAQRAGVILGTAAGGINTWDDNYRDVYENGKNRVHPFVVPKLMNNAAVSQVSMEHHIKGPCFTVSTACASSNHAMGLAFQMIRAGAADAMLTGGSEAMLTFGGIKAWEGLRVMSKDGCRPFSADRNGMVQGEGAGIFVFESHETAKVRGADILAEVAGFAMSADATDIVVPSQQGAVHTMRVALQDAGLLPSQVGYVNAHGTGTKINDKTECAAIADVFGSYCDNGLLVSSTKSMHGHLIGATGAVELLACIMALRDGIIAPTIGFSVPDRECALDVVPNTARKAQVGATLSNAFAFGGLNAVLVLKAVPFF